MFDWFVFVGVFGSLLMIMSLELFGVISPKTGNLLTAVLWGFWAIVGFVRDDVVRTGWSTAFALWHLYCWWKGGGGDDTKRRLREFGKKFQGMRRTAPVTT